MVKRKIILYISIPILLLFLTTSLYSKNILSDEAKKYYKRAQQAMGNNDLNTASTFLKKAATLNPYSAKICNDLGIIYEKKGMLNKAREQYKRALDIKPDYAPAYMNLAFLEEREGNTDKAIFYWKARIAFGKPSDEWTKKAKVKLKEYAPEEMKKIQAGNLIREVLNKLKINQKEKQQLVEKHINFHLNQGKSYLKKGEYYRALEEFQIADSISKKEDPKIKRLLSRTNVKIMKHYFTRGLNSYRKKDYQSAKYNFNKIIQKVKKTKE